MATGSTSDLQANGHWIGLNALDSNPVGSTAQDFALFQELWSKLRWGIGDSLQLPYGKRSWAGELAHRLALRVLVNHKAQHNQNGRLFSE